MKTLLVLVTTVLGLVARSRPEAFPSPAILKPFEHHNDQHEHERSLVDEASHVHIVQYTGHDSRPALRFDHVPTHTLGLDHGQKLYSRLGYAPRPSLRFGYVPRPSLRLGYGPRTSLRFGHSPRHFFGIDQGPRRSLVLDHVPKTPLILGHRPRSFLGHSYGPRPSLGFGHGDVLSIAHGHDIVHPTERGHEITLPIQHSHGIIHPTEPVHEIVHPTEPGHVITHHVEHSHEIIHPREQGHRILHPIKHGHSTINPLEPHFTQSNRITHLSDLSFLLGHGHRARNRQDHIPSHIFNKVFSHGPIHMSYPGPLENTLLYQQNLNPGYHKRLGHSNGNEHGLGGLVRPSRRSHSVALASHPNGGHSFVFTRRLGKREAISSADSYPQSKVESEMRPKSEDDLYSNMSSAQQRNLDVKTNISSKVFQNLARTGGLKTLQPKSEGDLDSNMIPAEHRSLDAKPNSNSQDGQDLARLEKLESLQPKSENALDSSMIPAQHRSLNTKAHINSQVGQDLARTEGLENLQPNSKDGLGSNTIPAQQKSIDTKSDINSQIGHGLAHTIKLENFDGDSSFGLLDSLDIGFEGFNIAFENGLDFGSNFPFETNFGSKLQSIELKRQNFGPKEIFIDHDIKNEIEVTLPFGLKAYMVGRQGIASESNIPVEQNNGSKGLNSESTKQNVMAKGSLNDSGIQNETEVTLPSAHKIGKDLVAFRSNIPVGPNIESKISNIESIEPSSRAKGILRVHGHNVHTLGHQQLYAGQSGLSIDHQTGRQFQVTNQNGVGFGRTYNLEVGADHRTASGLGLLVPHRSNHIPGQRQRYGVASGVVQGTIDPPINYNIIDSATHSALQPTIGHVGGYGLGGTLNSVGFALDHGVQNTVHNQANPPLEHRIVPTGAHSGGAIVGHKQSVGRKIGHGVGPTLGTNYNMIIRLNHAFTPAVNNWQQQRKYQTTAYGTPSSQVQGGGNRVVPTVGHGRSPAFIYGVGHGIGNRLGHSVNEAGSPAVGPVVEYDIRPPHTVHGVGGHNFIPHGLNYIMPHKVGPGISYTTEHTAAHNLKYGLHYGVTPGTYYNQNRRNQMLNHGFGQALVHADPRGHGFHIHTEEHIQNHNSHVFENKYRNLHRPFYGWVPGQQHELGSRRLGHFRNYTPLFNSYLPY